MEENNQNPNTPQPVPMVVQTPPVSNPKSKLPILIIGIILFLLVVGSAAGFYIFKQQSLKTESKPTPSPVVQKQIPTLTPDPTANWKTYTNTTLGYSIKYPDGIQINNIDQIDIEIVRIGVKRGGQGGNVPAGGMALYDRSPNNIDLIDPNRSSKNITINGYKVIEMLGNQQTPYLNDYFISDLNNKRMVRLLINTSGDQGYEKSTFDTFNQMVNTFKFTNQTSALPTPESVVGWKSVSLPFLTMQVPKEWDLWSCGNDLYVFMKNNPQPQADVLANNCPFDGNSGELHVSKSKTNYNSIDAAIPKSTSETLNNPESSGTYTITTTVSEIKNIEIDGKTGATWKTINKTSLFGGGQGDGTYGGAIILPNINISLMNYDNIQTFNKVLTTIKIVN